MEFAESATDRIVRRNRWILGAALTAVAACETAVTGTGDAFLSLRTVAAEGVALAAVDEGRAHIEGPSPRTISITPGTTQTVEGLLPGGYTVSLEGLTGGEVEVYGETSVTVVAGTNRTATVMLSSFIPVIGTLPSTVTSGQSVNVQFDPVTGANGYRVEWAANPSFSNAQSVDVTATNASITLTAIGAYFVRVRAKNRFGSLGRPSTNATVTAAPDVAPLTNHIAYTSHETGNEEVWVIPAAGGAATKLTSGGSVDRGRPDISPDGRRIVYNIAQSLAVMNADGSSSVTLPGSGCYPDWSPDGLRIAATAFCTPSGITIRNTDGSNIVQVTPAGSPDLAPRWSPDGRRLVFHSARDGNDEIYIVDADGTNLTRLTNDAASDRYPAFSPDGTKITWERISSGRSDLWSMNPDGSRKAQITNDAEADARPDWSPGRERLVLVRDSELKTYNPDGTDPVVLTNTGGAAGNSIPHWGPCLESGCQPATGQAEIVTATTGAGTDIDGFTVSVDGGPSKPIGANGIVTFIELHSSNHTVTLSDIASNCTIGGSATITVSVNAGKLSQPPPFAVTCTAVAAPPGQAVLTHRYSFSESGGAGTALIDAVGGANGTIVDIGPNNATVGGGRVTLTGGDAGVSDYVEIPIAFGQADATIELWAGQTAIRSWSRVFEYGVDGDHFIGLTWTEDTDPNAQLLAFNGSSEAIDTRTTETFTPGTEYHIVLTIDGGGGTNGSTLLRLYRNAILVGTLETSNRLSDLAGGRLRLGESFFSDPTASAFYNELRVYDGVLSAGQIQQNFLTGTNGATSNLLLVTPSVANFGYVGQSIGLFATALDAAGNPVTTGTITWTTSDASVATVDPNGDITARGPGTARITAKDGTRTGTMDVNVDIVVPSTANLGFHRYAVTSNIYNWFDARDLAASVGGHLAVVTSGPENTFIANTFHNPPNRHIWIGLSDLRVEDLFEWIDDSPSSPGATTSGTGFAAWDSGEPNNSGDENCVHYAGVSGFWNDLDCSGELYALVEWAYSGPAVLRNIQVYNGHRYATTVDALTWVQARNLAASLGGHLVIVNDAAENQFLSDNYVKPAPANTWIGLNDREAHGVFGWPDGSPVTYLNWLPGGPDNAGGNEHCAAFWPLGANLAGWNDAPCAFEMVAIIEFDNFFIAQPPPVDFGGRPQESPTPGVDPAPTRRGSRNDLIWQNRPGSRGPALRIDRDAGANGGS